jgi:hypothetical protein
VRGALATLALLAVLATGCGSGDDSSTAAPGTPDNPLAAKLPADGRPNEGASGKKQEPGYQDLVERQSSDPRSEFTPCNLVTPAQASRVLGARVAPPVEAPQGPTCIYRTSDGKQFVTVAVQPLDLGALRSQMRGRRAVDVAGRAGLCGRHGQPMLYVPLSDGRVLSVSGDCDVALRFASTAVDRLSG